MDRGQVHHSEDHDDVQFSETLLLLKLELEHGARDCHCLILGGDR